jgi:hypothetical protein
MNKLPCPRRRSGEVIEYDSLTSPTVQVFGCRHAETIPTLGQPASENLHMIGRVDPKALRQTFKGDAVA